MPIGDAKLLRGLPDDPGERGIVGVAMAHIEPGGLPTPFSGGGSGGGGGNALIPESTLASSLVIVAWIVFWTAIGAWRMKTRDA